MGNACSTYRGEEKSMKMLLESLKERGHLEEDNIKMF
jgi:hypothetical protein